MPPGLEIFIQLGAFAVLVLYVTQDRKDAKEERVRREAAAIAERQERQAEAAAARHEMAQALNASSISTVTLQQMFLIVTVGRGDGETHDSDDCRRLGRSMEVINQLLETQRVEMIKNYEAKDGHPH